MNKYKVLNKNEIIEKYSDKEFSKKPFEIGIPLFEISEKALEEIYYFRWSVYSKHIKPTPSGFVITEFLPKVAWAGKNNTISCAASHHFAEGRWLHNEKFLTDYARFWLSEDAEPRKYSFPLADSVYSFCEVKGCYALAMELYDGLKENFFAWEKTHLDQCGLFYQTDNRDGMELSISGNGLRPSINSYMFAELTALSKIALLKGKNEEHLAFQSKAQRLKLLINDLLWDTEAEFYKNRSESKSYEISQVRELIGYIPWIYSLAPQEYSSAWKFLVDENHFDAPYGPTTAERCHPDFLKEHTHECLWNGPSWPYATSQTLCAMINLLKNYSQPYVNKNDFYRLLLRYANTQYIENDGKMTPFVDENHHPFKRMWLAREILKSRNPEAIGKERGKDYNHSSFCDLVIRGIAGLGIKDGQVVLNPLFDESIVDYFCLDGAEIHGEYYTVIYDKDGSRYGMGKGLKLLK